MRLHRFASSSCLTDNARGAGGALIHLVDDEQGLIELYSLLLKGAGFRVRGFNCRADALAGLKAEGEKPDLLVTDCLRDTMPIHLFIQSCRMAHPALRILMASGLSEHEVRSYCLRPDRFLRKPFTAAQFVREVSAALTAFNTFCRDRVSGSGLA
jgi:DNA-binding NtrC family response regulator